MSTAASINDGSDETRRSPSLVPSIVSAAESSTSTTSKSKAPRKPRAPGAAAAKPRKKKDPTPAEQDATSGINPPTNAAGSRKGKERAVPPPEEVIEVKDEEGEDDDSPVFVGEAMARKLAERFSFQQKPLATSVSSAGSSSAAAKEKPKPASGRPKKEKTEGGGEDSGVKVKMRKGKGKKEEAGEGSLALYPPKEAEPAPAWLGGTTAMLKVLIDCPLCATRWKKNESGPARWVSQQRASS
jgi:hypothetical protein